MPRLGKPSGEGRSLLNHGPGKGDAPRYRYSPQWRQNYDEIDWKREAATTEQRQVKYRKVYR